MQLKMQQHIGGKQRTRSVEYDGQPQSRYQVTDACLEAETGEQVFGCHVVWCYYKAGRRVATIVVDRGNVAVQPSVAHRLRRCWPECVEFGVPEQLRVDETEPLGQDAKPRGGVAWMSDGQGASPWSFTLEMFFSDAVFLHPQDDKAYDAEENLTLADREWIVARDQAEAANVARLSYPLKAGRLEVLDEQWQKICVEGAVFDLKSRKQIKKALQFLFTNGYTSGTGQRAAVAAVCQAAGQHAKQSSLHSIFHVMNAPKDATVDYDRLYDLLLDNRRGQGVWLKV